MDENEWKIKIKNEGKDEGGLVGEAAGRWVNSVGL